LPGRDGWGSGAPFLPLADREASGPAPAEPPPARSLDRLPVDRWPARSAGSGAVSAGGCDQQNGRPPREPRRLAALNRAAAPPSLDQPAWPERLPAARKAPGPPAEQAVASAPLENARSSSTCQENCCSWTLRDREAMGGHRVGPLCRRGAGQGPVHHTDAERSGANVHTGGLVSPLRRPPTMRRAGAEPHREPVAAQPLRCSPPWQ
jgi:hypothetical protein